MKQLSIILLVFCISFSWGCLSDWNNSCVSNADCCSNFCDNNYGQWREGVCKPRRHKRKCNKDYIEDDTYPKIGSGGRGRGGSGGGSGGSAGSRGGCKPLWFNMCKSDGECCSGYCDNRNGEWEYGVCKPSK